MKKFYTYLVAAFAVITINPKTSNAQCPVAGTASATEDSICDNGTTTLLLTGYTGNIQWQSFDGSQWINEAGAGATTDTYTLTVPVTTSYRAFLTLAACPSDSSNTVVITTGVIPVPSTTGDTRCGYGPVNLQAAGAANFNWYNVSTGGSVLATGPTYSPNVATTTTFYVEALSGGGNANPLTTTFAGGNGFDGNMFDIEAVNQVTITDFECNCNAGTGYAQVWYKAGTHVGFTGSSTGWTYVDSVLITTAGAGTPTPVPININVTIPAGQTYAFYFHFAGGVTYSNGTAVGNIAAQDANIIVREGYGGAYFNLVNMPRIWNGIVDYTSGCTSARSPVTATVTFADSVDINATATALCQGTSATLSASSNNAGYSYTWSPATGLNTTTGATVIATPLTPTTYTVVGTDGTCANIDSVYINVGPASVAGTASINTDTICTGTTATLTLTGSTGSIQWQSNNGTIWVNETGQGFDSSVYVVSPTSFTQYQAIVTSGGCAPDTTIVLSVDVLTISDPTTVNDTICGPGIVNLSASGTGTLNWYAGMTGNTVLNSGTTYGPTISTTTTYYVEASAGAMYHVGPANPSIGNQTTTAALDYGLQFDCNKQCILQRVHISAAQTGTITVNLRALQGGPILQTITQNVTAFGGQIPLDLGFSISPGTAYRLELQTGSAQLYRNTAGAVYPYVTANNPITITGYVNPNFGTAAQYFWFYDWVVDDGCHSNRIPVSGVVNQIPPVPTISQTFNTLSSSSPTGNQWYFNGVLMAGETGQVLVITQTGNYTVVVSSGPGCSTTSAVFTVTFIGVKELAGNAYSVYPNPTTGNITIKFANPIKANALLRITDAVGRNVFEQTTTTVLSEIKLNTKLPSGNYFMEIKTNGGVAKEKIQVVKN